MLGKYKGFYVPGKDRARRVGFLSDTPQNYFCNRMNADDCRGCEWCLFCPEGRKPNNDAFKEWHKAKGRVAYA